MNVIAIAIGALYDGVNITARIHLNPCDFFCEIRR